MAATDHPRHPVDHPWNSTIEHCEACEDATSHEVGIEILSESADPAHAGPSREPYRVATCRVCGERTITRMNNA